MWLTIFSMVTSTNGATLDLATDLTPLQHGVAAVAAGVFGVAGADASAVKARRLASSAVR